MNQRAKTSQASLFFLGCAASLVLVLCMAVAILYGTLRLFGDGFAPLIALVDRRETREPPTLSPTLRATAILPERTADPTPVPAATRPPRPTPTPPPPPVYAFADAPNLDQRYIAESAWADLERLLAADYPARDYYETEERLGKKKLRGRTLPPEPRQIGEQRTFWTGEREVDARLVLQSERAFFWVEAGLSLSAADLWPVGQRLDRELYPRLTALFGREPGPGIDGELPIHIVHLTDFDTEELGYFDSSDQYPREIFGYSNQVDGIYINMSELRVGERLYYGTLVHEIQHLLHWLSDSNETTWLDEGLAQVAEVYTGLDTFTVIDYLEEPNLQFNSWSVEEDRVYAHYASAALFGLYFWEQLGDDALRDLFQHPGDGLAAVAAVLRRYRPETTLAGFVGDWYAANYLRRPPPNRYGYRYDFRQIRPAAVMREPGAETMALNPYGVRYIEIDQPGEVLFSFAGDTLVDLIDAAPRSGQAIWFVPPLYGVEATLTRSFDLRGVQAPALSFWSWYDLEADFDFAYVTVSTNGGQSWAVLAPGRGVTSPFGRGISGRSRDAADAVDGWVHETISLAEYAGQEILVRFEVLTDAAIAGRGFALDDIEVTEIDYFSDVETGEDGWTAAGFVRVGASLPQQWSLQLLSQEGEGWVTPLSLDSYNQGQWRLRLEGPVTLAVAPVTPFSARPARYWFKIERLP